MVDKTFKSLTDITKARDAIASKKKKKFSGAYFRNFEYARKAIKHMLCHKDHIVRVAIFYKGLNKIYED